MRKKWFLLLLFVLSLNSTQAQEQSTGTFVNPILESGADPFVFLHTDGFYYCMVTRGNRLTLWKSKSFTDLAAAESKDIWFPPKAGPNSSSIWAPEIHFLQNAWYVYYSACDKTNPVDITRYVFVLRNKSADPLTGEWEDMGKIDTEYPGIDGSVFEFRKKLYFVYSPYVGRQSGIAIAEMKSPWEIIKPVRLLSLPGYEWEKTGEREIMEGPQFLEGPGKMVFLIYSASACWDDDYSLGMLSAGKKSDLLNKASWSKADHQVFRQCPDSSVYGPGHNCFTLSPDGKEDWIVYHGKRQSSDKCAGRSMRAQPFTWDRKGMPLFGPPFSVKTKLKLPSGI